MPGENPAAAPSRPAPSRPAASRPAALELTGVRAGYGRIEVVHGVDLVVPEGGIAALLGVNGAGKSTLLKVVSGQLRASTGSVAVAGRVLRAGVTAATKAGVCLVPEGRGVFGTLTVDENLTLASYFRGPAGAGGDRADGRRGGRGASYSGASTLRDRVYELFPTLGQRRRQRAGLLSGGEQQMLAVGRALASRPAVLLLDEVSMGLAPTIVTEIYAAVATAATGGMTILLVEQYAERALAVADTATILRAGQVVASGAPDALRDRLGEFYLGGAA